MLVKLEHPKLLSEGIAIISELVTEVKLKFDKDGMSLVAIDPANVSLVSFKLPSHAFAEFEVTNDVLGVSLESLKNVLKRCNPGSSSDKTVYKQELIQQSLKKSQNCKMQPILF